MKITAKRTISALLALLMLVLAVPMTGMLAFAADEAAEETIYFSTAHQTTATKFNTPGSWSGNVTTSKTIVTDANGDVFSRYAAYLKSSDDVKLGEINYDIGSPSSVNSAIKDCGATRDRFLYEISFGQNDNPINFVWRQRYSPFSGGTINLPAYDANGQMVYKLDGESYVPYTETVAAAAFKESGWEGGVAIVELAIGGDLKAFGQEIGNVKEGSYHLSIAMTYSAAKSAYLVDIFVNGALMYDDYVFNHPYQSYTKTGSTATIPAGEGYLYDSESSTYVATETETTVTYKYVAKLSSKTFHDGYESYVGNAPGSWGAQFRQSSSKYNQIVTDPTAQGFILEEDGQYWCTDDLVVNNIGFYIGTVTPQLNTINRSALTLFANGKTADGYAVTKNNADIISKSISASEIDADGYITLPAVADGWFDVATDEPITKVSAEKLGTGEIAAYTTEPDGLIYETDFTDGYGKLIPTVGQSGVKKPYVENGVYIIDSNDAPYIDGDKEHNKLHAYDRNVGYDFGTSYTASVGGRMTMTISFTVIRGEDGLTPMTMRFRNFSTSTANILEIRKDDVRFANYVEYPIAAGESVDIVVVVDVVNNPSGTNATRTCSFYANGVSCGTHTNTAFTGTLNTGSNTDIASLQLQHNCTNWSAHKRVTYLDDFRFYSGVDPVTVPEIENLSGAAIRLDDTADESGIRFSFRMLREKYEAALAAGGEIGALLVPTDWLESGKLSALTHAAIAEATLAEGERVVDQIISGCSSESDEKYCCFNISIVKLLAENYAREFTAVAYIKHSDGSYTYSHLSDSRSVNEVARKYAASSEYADASAEKKAVVKGYLDQVIVLETVDNDLKAVDVEGVYTTPYEISYAPGTLTMSGEGMESVKAVIIDGEVYTGGWTLTEGNTYTAPYTVPSAE